MHTEHQAPGAIGSHDKSCLWERRQTLGQQ